MYAFAAVKLNDYKQIKTNLFGKVLCIVKNELISVLQVTAANLVLNSRDPRTLDSIQKAHILAAVPCNKEINAFEAYTRPDKTSLICFENHSN